MNPKNRQIWIKVAGIAFAVIFTICVIIFRDDLKDLIHLGLPGAFLVSLISDASIIFPVPGIVVTTALGSLFAPWKVALAAASGSAIGELTGYIAGYSGRGLVGDTEKLKKVSGYMTKYGFLTVLVLALIPNPLFDLAGLFAGSTKIPVWKFILATFIGKLGKFLVFAYLGSGLGKLLPQ